MSDDLTPAEAAASVEISATRLCRLIQADAPALILEGERRILLKRVARLPSFCPDYDEQMAKQSPDSAGEKP